MQLPDPNMEPRRVLVLISADPKKEHPGVYTETRPKGYAVAAWQFVLEPLGEKATRLLVRQRLAYSPDMSWVWRLTEPVAFVMERKMLFGIRRRAELNL